ncbi:5,10-methylenetetrahydrofolate reductase [Alkalihalobacillus alcalophilus ATCC 27647 = CGMCC 1.3604]|uniref:5,10-methylenetetrahydrofolate reductase n=1 Tax=Alkalihalobacillus alcalophilus ATCC 27647 = CGMCC 1.3604 TaxID=1218173 RepID=A0A094XK99_ALKAL|nr:bifunctional homocysteine S-methyltransferase/methylenetetrahydrofolate reductase [Alkalihalobacillus alcalophilus]KGA99170.1 homocysteine methyltransferase [Alkalihalobacillus alcalophilus ATCC 27647 = CGMCC 1.3604]MED1562493.1 bifunctional homocysteine S-methyltransferase/methylenetetrahydrofolate reductase [Alkalihalobacillus alcalophilus]THG90645.1 5,10-methylenetetrahydrofolate reductase [Alkalihalobacillus alcalophilus ATCC 27647 = CGMCC 1.3604]
MNLIEKLQNNLLVGDGAMGTLLYEQGIDQCFEEINLLHPEKIKAVHQAYIDAGANVIQTNTYAANRLKLEKYGLEDKVRALNKAGVQIASEVANEEIYILGTVGGIRRYKNEEWTLAEIKSAFFEQMTELLKEGVDGLLLETFYDLEEALMATQLARKLTDQVLVVNVSVGEVGVMQGGVPLEKAFQQLIEAGANVVGLNCRMGPFHMLKSIETVSLPKGAYLAVYPNASLPDFRDGRYYYQSNSDYFADMGERFIEQGVRLIGGCCGTTPEQIKAFAEVAKVNKPVNEKKVKSILKVDSRQNQARPKRETLPDIVKKRSSIIVELDPPKRLSIEKFMNGAKALTDAGVDAVTLADNSLASPRVDNMALGSLMKAQYSTRPLVHVTCRDRNLIGLQSHLMGLHALGIQDLLAITGDPTKIGDFPGATSVYDMTSFQLISMIKQLNEGLSFSGKDLGQKANFSVGAAFNPNVRHLEKAVARMEKKVESGADYFMTQPIYNEKQIEELAKLTKHIEQPIYIGIMPLTGSRNAEFLHNEVPGIKLTDSIRETMKKCEHDKEQSVQEGLTIAKSLIDATLDHFNGIYLITPFLRYEMSVELTQYIQEKQQQKEITLQ